MHYKTILNEFPNAFSRWCVFLTDYCLSVCLEKSFNRYLSIQRRLLLHFSSLCVISFCASLAHKKIHK